jgi:hypothetical protein
MKGGKNIMRNKTKYFFEKGGYVRKIVVGLFICFLVSSALAGTGVTYVVATSEDDTYARTGVNAYTAVSTISGRAGANNYDTYFRWQVNIPTGAKITYSLISMRAYVAGTGAPALAAFLVDTANCPSFSSDPTGLPWSIDSVNYGSPGAPAWGAGLWYSILTVDKLVQAFINKSEYASGNYMGIKFGFAAGGSGTDKYRTAYQFDQSSTTVSSARLAVYYNQTPSVPIPLLPINNSSTYSLQPQFSWNTATDPDGDAIRYNFVLDTVTTFNSLSVTSVNYATGTTFTPGGNLAAGIWYWRVQSIDSSTNPISNFVTATSAWCATQKVTLLVNQPPGVVSLITPPDASSTNDRTPTFIWSSTTDPDIGDTVSYRVQVDDDINFGSINYQNAFSANTSTTPLVELGNGFYYWRVIAQDTSFAASTSGLWTLTIENRPPDAVTLISPANASSTQDHNPTFVWNPGTDPDAGDTLSYKIQVADDIGFTSIVLELAFDVVTTASRGSDFATGSYYWRIISRDTSLATNTSSAWTITIENRPPNAVTLDVPPDATQTFNHTPYFRWFTATDPDAGDTVIYEIQIDNDADFSSPAYAPGFSSGTTAQPGLGTGYFYWRVISQDTSLAQNTSETRTLTIKNQPPNAVSLIQPLDSSNTADHTPLFAWDTTTDPDAGDSLDYFLEVSTTISFSDIAYSSGFSSATTATPGTDLPTGLYYWRVISRDTSLATNTSSAWWFIAYDTTTHQQTVNATGTTVFYLGTGADYTPVTFVVNSVTGTDTVTVSVFDAKHPNATDSTGNLGNQYFISRWVRISNTGGISSADITFTYTDADFTDANFGALAEDQISFAKWNGISWTWLPSSDRDVDANWIKLNGITSFSDWTLSGPGGVPVELSRFEVNIE